MRIGLMLLLICGMGLAEKPSAAVVLKNGKEVKTFASPKIEKNMLAMVDKNGRKVLVSKNLIDWEATREISLEFYLLAYPEQAQEWVANGKPGKARLEKPRKKIVITNDAIEALPPDEGLAAEWAGENQQAPIPPKETSSKNYQPIIKTITHGDAIKVDDHLESGRLVVFDFYADWCGPCRKLTPELEKLVKLYPNQIALKKVDIIKWGTPVAKQFDIRSIPYLEVYDEKGRQKLKGNGFQVLRSLQGMAKKEKW